MKIVAISGSLRAVSSNTAQLRAMIALAPPEMEITPYERLGDLPHFNPDLDVEGATPPAPVSDLRARLLLADAVVISTPEYAHGVPGALKNALDWLVSDGGLVGKPVVLLTAPRATYARDSLAETLRTMSWRVIPIAAEKDAAREALDALRRLR